VQLNATYMYVYIYNNYDPVAYKLSLSRFTGFIPTI
jgi:hypothetical protein